LNIFVLPLQINALVLTANIFVSGFFNPYLSHFVYLGDLFLILSVFFFIISSLFSEIKFSVFFDFNERRKKIFYLFILLLVLSHIFSLFFSVNFLNSIIYLLRLFEFLVVFLFISSGFVKQDKLMFVFIFSLFLVSFIGIFQYLIQHSVGFRFLGEPSITSDALGVAKVGLFDKNVLRVYGTFPHPNIFAGYLLFALFFVIYSLRISSSKILRIFLISVLIFFVLLLILTFSRSAMLAFLFGIFSYFLFMKKKIYFRYLFLALWLFLLFAFVFDLYEILFSRFFILDDGNVFERGLFLDVSKNMFFNNFLGVGAGNFTLVMQDFTSYKLSPWLFQPVHNSFLLMFNELGILGGSVFLLFFIYQIFDFIKNRISKFSVMLLSLCFSLFVIMFFDHYPVSLYQGQALLWIFFGLGFRSRYITE
jgi:O-antigen ligase